MGARKIVSLIFPCGEIMEVVSSSNLVSLEAEKITASNFQTMPINSFVMSHDLTRGHIGSYGYM